MSRDGLYWRNVRQTNTGQTPGPKRKQGGRTGLRLTQGRQLVIMLRTVRLLISKVVRGSRVLGDTPRCARKSASCTRKYASIDDLPLTRKRNNKRSNFAGSRPYRVSKQSPLKLKCEKNRKNEGRSQKHCKWRGKGRMRGQQVERWEGDGG